ncbi:transposase [Oenococcus oeni]|nr:transposase [Oenococcus oeni]
MKYYSDEFKNNIVKLYHNENRSKKSLANEYGVHPTTISHWIKRAKLVEPDGGVTSVEAFKQLQKENQQLKEENEILKAAAVLLGRH